MANVGFTRKEIKRLLPSYYLIRDCIEGEVAIKAARTKYLPMPNSSDTSPQNLSRYKAYLERAVFYNATQRTLYGLAGQIFVKDPVIEIPTLLDTVNIDANGDGVSLTQLMRRDVLRVLSYGRAGLLVDYPTTTAPASREQLLSGDIRPVMRSYAPWDIINWRTITRGARRLLSLVVLQEVYQDPVDDFEVMEKTQYRVLQLIDNVYTAAVYRKVGSIFEPDEGPFVPTDANGSPFSEIPFMFLGSENNDEYVDLPPLYDLASLNVAHYRNSADYEESCFIVGQPTPVITGLSEEWYEKVLQKQINFGSRGGIPLPTGATAELLQAEPNTMPKEAMEHKEQQMVSLGAKLVEEKAIQRTATEVNSDDAAETSTLVASAKNVSAGYTWGMKKAAEFVGASNGEIKVELHTDFQISRMSADERRELVSEWQQSAISFSEMRAILRKIGIATLDDEKARAEINSDTKTQIDLETQASIDVITAKNKGGAGNVGNKE